MFQHGKIICLVTLLSLFLSLTSASAPPKGVTIDYSFSNSLFVNNADSGMIPQAALNNDFPDPSVIRLNESMYAFGTSAGRSNVQMATRHTSQGGWNLWHSADALPRLPGWVEAKDPQVWAPNIVSLVRHGSTEMYYLVSHLCSSSSEPNFLCSLLYCSQIKCTTRSLCWYCNFTNSYGTIYTF